MLRAIDNIPNIEEINEALTNQDDEEIGTAEQQKVNASNSLGEPINVIPQPNSGGNNEDISCTSTNNKELSISAIAPRSKFNLQMFEKGCTLINNKSEQINVHFDQVKHIIMFPKREDCLKVPKRNKDAKKQFVLPGSMVLFVLYGDGVTFREKPLTQICFQLPDHFSDYIDSENDEEIDHSKLSIVDSYENNWCELFKASFHVKDVARIYNPKLHKVTNGFYFQSDQGDNNTSLMQGGMPFVKCYSGAYLCVLFFHLHVQEAIVMTHV